MQGTVGFTTFTTWPFWVCAPRRAPDFTTFTTLTRALVGLVRCCWEAAGALPVSYWVAGVMLALSVAPCGQGNGTSTMTAIILVLCRFNLSALQVRTARLQSCADCEAQSWFQPLTYLCLSYEMPMPSQITTCTQNTLPNPDAITALDQR